MLLKKNRFGGEFLACEKYPKCKTARSLETDIPCANSNCTGKLVPRMTKRGLRFYGCSRYPECNFLLWGKPVQQPCPECQSPLADGEDQQTGGYVPGLPQERMRV